MLRHSNAPRTPLKHRTHVHGLNDIKISNRKPTKSVYDVMQSHIKSREQTQLSLAHPPRGDVHTHKCVAFTGHFVLKFVCGATPTGQTWHKCDIPDMLTLQCTCQKHDSHTWLVFLHFNVPRTPLMCRTLVHDPNDLQTQQITPTQSVSDVMHMLLKPQQHAKLGPSPP